MKVSITTQSNGRDDAQAMVIDTVTHDLYRGCVTLEDVRARCQEILDSYIVFGASPVRIVAIEAIIDDGITPST